MNITASTTLPQMAFIVGTALRSDQWSAVLTGGAAAAVYAPIEVQSHDLDFIFEFKLIEEAIPEQRILTLGFRRKGTLYAHDLSPFTLEFPPGPLAIGEELVNEWSTLTDGDLTLDILSPTDSVKDRLCWFLHYGDVAGMAQALAVARAQQIDLTNVESWAAREGRPDRFAIFLRELERGS